MEFFLAAQVGITLLQARQQARLQRRMASIRAIQGQIQLEAAQFQARFARKAGAEHATSIRRESRRGAGAAVVRTEAAGVEIIGSPLISITEQIWQDERAASTAIINAEAGATQIQLRGRSAQAGAEADAFRLREQAGITETAGWLNAGALAISAVTRSPTTSPQSGPFLSRSESFELFGG